MFFYSFSLDFFLFSFFFVHFFVWSCLTLHFIFHRISSVLGNVSSFSTLVSKNWSKHCFHQEDFDWLSNICDEQLLLFFFSDGNFRDLNPDFESFELNFKRSKVRESKVTIIEWRYWKIKSFIFIWIFISLDNLGVYIIRRKITQFYLNHVTRNNTIILF